MTDLTAVFIDEEGSITTVVLSSNLARIKITITSNLHPEVREIEVSGKEALVLRGLIDLIKPAVEMP